MTAGQRGLMKGAVIGAGVGALAGYLIPGVTRFGSSVMALGMVGVAVGFMAGVPIWRKGAYLKGLVKGIVGGLLGAGIGAFTLWIAGAVAASVSGILMGHPIILGTLVGAIYGAVVEKDDGTRQLTA